MLPILRHYALTIADTELTDVERNARAATNPDDIELRTTSGGSVHAPIRALCFLRSAGPGGGGVHQPGGRRGRADADRLLRLTGGRRHGPGGSGGARSDRRRRRSLL